MVFQFLRSFKNHVDNVNSCMSYIRSLDIMSSELQIQFKVSEIIIQIQRITVDGRLIWNEST